MPDDPNPLEELLIREGDLKIADNIYRQMLCIATDEQMNNGVLTPAVYDYFNKLDSLQEDRIIKYLAWRLAKYKLDVRAETQAICAASELSISTLIHDTVTVEYKSNNAKIKRLKSDLYHIRQTGHDKKCNYEHAACNCFRAEHG